VGRNVVCISRAIGADGEEIGKRVAEQLGFTFADEQIVADAAARGGIDPASVASEEERKSLAARVLEALALAGGVGLAGGAVPLPADEDRLSGPEIRVLIREAIEHMAAQGNVVIVAHAASHALPGRPDVLRVLVTASPKTRAQRIADSEGLDQDRATQAMKESDAARRDYLRRFYDLKDELPTQYDLVVNTDFLSLDEAVQLIEVAATKHQS
jgi:hypothetical protein